MFGKSSRETPKSQIPEIPELKLPENLIVDGDKETKSLATKPKPQMNLPQVEGVTDIETSELVNTVEKISRIASPYFIAIVGLSLYKDNFFIGTILIMVGILSLLKVSPRDVATFLEWFKDFLGFSDEDS